MSLLEAKSIKVFFGGHDDHGRQKTWAAVNGVSFSLEEGERIGIIGESGSGKTTLGKALLGLETLSEGSVLFQGQELKQMSSHTLRHFRRSVQMIFQDPLGSLNPRLTVGGALHEVLAVHNVVPRSQRVATVEMLLSQVGLEPDYAGRYPHEFSGGQRQRIGIVRALALSPRLLVADEPVSALDVSVQAQILNLIRDLSIERKMALILVAHDLAVVNYVCERVLIMYKGQIVEEGPTSCVFSSPAHPYTRLLKESVPDPDDLPNAVSSPGKANHNSGPAAHEIVGCSFAGRCGLAGKDCFTAQPALNFFSDDRKVACHMVKTLER